MSTSASVYREFIQSCSFITSSLLTESMSCMLLRVGYTSDSFEHQANASFNNGFLYQLEIWRNSCTHIQLTASVIPGDKGVTNTFANSHGLLRICIIWGQWSARSLPASSPVFNNQDLPVLHMQWSKYSCMMTTWMCFLHQQVQLHVSCHGPAVVNVPYSSSRAFYWGGPERAPH